MKRMKPILTSKRFRIGLSVAVLLVTISVFVRFFANNPEYLKTLSHVSPAAVGAIMLLNLGTLISLLFVYQFILLLCGKQMTYGDQFLLTAYSSISNFFGPLQSGLGVRAVYVKSKLKVRARDYVAATMVYYAIFALFSALFMLGGSRAWWQTLIGLAVVATICYFLLKRVTRRTAGSDEQIGLRFSAQIILGLALATLSQICFVAGYYAVELHAIGAHPTFGQVISYAGTANFAIFVAITPDAIGIRESFLALGRELHHVSGATILSANLLDRAAYALFLVLLFVVVLSLHAKRRLGLRKQPSEDQPLS